MNFITDFQMVGIPEPDLERGPLATGPKRKTTGRESQVGQDSPAIFRIQPII